MAPPPAAMLAVTPVTKNDEIVAPMLHFRDGMTIVVFDNDPSPTPPGLPHL
jgi:hypothetical protein